jgi:nonribosomal peptide synthetase DhbF
MVLLEDILTSFPLTTGQGSIWIAQALDRESPAYNMGECIDIPGEFNCEAFERAVRLTVLDSNSLSLAFIETDEGPRQFVAPRPEWTLTYEDFSGAADPQQDAWSWMQDDLAKPLEIRFGSPFRFALLRLSAQRHWFYAINHHLVNDGFGWRLVLGRIAENYQRLAAGFEAQPRPFQSMLDIATAEKAYRESSRFARDREYWLSQLQDRPKLSLAAPGAQASDAVEWASGYISRSIDLDGLGRRLGASPVAVLVAAAALYTFRQTNAVDLVIGLQVSARLGEGLRDAIGLTTNIVPLRLKLEPSWSFARLIEVAAPKVREALRHQQYRAEDLVRDLAIPPKELDLFNLVVNYIPLDESFAFTDHPIRRFPLGNWRVPDFQIAYYDGSYENGRRVDIIANAGKYPAPLAQLHCERFCHLFNASAMAPEALCIDVARMPAEEREQIVVQFNYTEKTDGEQPLVHRFIERQARECPDRPALRFKGVELSYERLNRQANKLARHLRESGVGPDTIVALCMERSIEMVLGILATLKAGGAYVPVDPGQPSERFALVLRDTAARCVLTTSETRSFAPESIAKVIVVDHKQLFVGVDDADIDRTEVPLTPDNLAYVIYTSGSTGIPKGVMIEHRALSNRMNWMQQAYRLGPDDRVLQKTPFTFDVSVWEFLWPLMVGATLVVATPREHLDAESLVRTIIENGVTTLHFVPSMLAIFLQESTSGTCTSLTRIICSGEALPADLADACMKRLPNAQLYNLYGPTEAAIDVTHWTCTPNKQLARVPIGRPIDNMQVYILDAERQPVAIGALGEIYLAGVGLARGYLNRPALTAEAFVANPFSDDPTARMYKTGDLGLWRPDGAIEYHGRNDNQVKIRGVRIELGEIETQIRLLPNIRDAAVAVESSVAGDQRLIGFFVTDLQAEGDASAAVTLRRLLSRRLPEAMIPSAFIRLDTFPLTASGKLDRQALVKLAAAPDPINSTGKHAFASPTELGLADIWSGLLGRNDFGRMDDFFDLGGHSLLATQMRSRIRSRFAIDAPLKVVFEHRVLADLAKAVDAALANHNYKERQKIEPAAECDAYVLSQSQQRMWLNQSLDPESTAYNLVGALKLKGSLNVGAISRALDELRRRHESLRSVFFDTAEGVRQRILPFMAQPLEETDLRPLAEQALTEAQRLAEQDARVPFDLSTGPVMRSLLFRTGDDEHLLYLAIHHISGDQWSFGVISRDLSALYNSFCKEQPPLLEPLPVQYRDYATWRRSDQEVARAQAELAYWKQKLDGLPTLDLPTDFPRPRLRTSQGSSVRVPLPAELLTRLERLSRREGVTLFMTMLAAFSVHLSRLTEQTDIAIGAPVANRTVTEIESLVGTFVNTLVMRIDLSERPTFRELLARVRDTALEAYSHQDASFDELVQVVRHARDDGRPPLAQVMFNLLNAPWLSASLNRLAWEQVEVDRGGAQFEVSVSVDPQVMNVIWFEYNSDLFKRATIERFAAQYMQLLDSVIADPATPIARFNLLPPSEVKILLDDWNATREFVAREKTFSRMFEEQVAAHPDAEALRFHREVISYQELNKRAEAVAQHLRARRVRPGVGVGVCLKRTPLLLAALLGVQKAGGHYIPLDPAAPLKRLEYTLSDSGLSILIADTEIGERLCAAHDVALLDERALSHPPPEISDRHQADASDLAYIIYTSGSTGRPKGVRVTQRGLTNFLDAMRHRPGMTERDSIVSVTTISFDISGLEFYLPLSVGGRLVLAPTDVAADGEQLGRLIHDSGANVLQATPATWRMLLDAGWEGDPNLRAFCGGEALSQSLAQDLLPRVKELWNLYGPTETTIWSTAARIEVNQPISIGAPIDNTRVYIVDSEGQICPIGIVGEIWIAGDGVAQGYQNLPELTSERFQHDPFAKVAYERLYKTGDRGAWGADGQLYHYGRSDNQLKIRGFRVEAEEVETLLRSHPAIRDAVVTGRSAGEGDARLIGYLIAEGGPLPTSSELRRFLRENAPDYMIPSIFVELVKFPLTPNGKLDRKALPDPFENPAGPPQTYVAPAQGAEQLIADVWKQLLKVDVVGANDNFFELGGHSLLALRVAALVKKKAGWRMDPRTLYFQTLRQIAASSHVVEGRGQDL